MIRKQRSTPGTARGMVGLADTAGIAGIARTVRTARAVRTVRTACIVRIAGAIATLAAAASLGACSGFHLSLERSQAMDEFSQDKSCPLDRLAVQSFLVPPREVLEPLEPPAAEVAADPARLAVWNRKVADHLDSYQDLSVMDISGCGAHRTSFCFEATDLTGAVVEMCREVNLESPQARLDDLRVVPAARTSILARLAAGQIGSVRAGT